MTNSALKDFLADLNNPTSLDPEADDALLSIALKNDENGRAHYASTERSQLRGIDLSSTYDGVPTSRKELEQSDGYDDDESDIEEGEEDYPADSAEPFGPVESGSESISSDAEDAEDQQDSSQHDVIANDDAQLIAQLKTAKTANIEKGKAVRKQLTFWDTLLEIRIKLQKIVNDLHSQSLSEENQSTQTQQLANLYEMLFDLQERLASANETMQVPPRKKRKLDSQQLFDVAQASEDLATLNQTYEPYLKSTIIKWSDKVSAASLSSLKAAKQFKSNSALNKNTWEQIQQILSTDSQRLIDRTKVSRTKSASTSEENKVDKVLDPEIFDDTDFYHALLKDAVDSQLLDIDDPSLIALKQAFQSKTKNRKGMDSRASKDRRLKYTVHEKLQNFMVPINTISWHEQQINELFGSLLGVQSRPDARKASEMVAQEDSIAPLRIFG